MSLSFPVPSVPVLWSRRHGYSVLSKAHHAYVRSMASTMFVMPVSPSSPSWYD